MHKKLQEINYKELYKATKQRMACDSKQIKSLLLYNYINDDIPTQVINALDNPKTLPKIVTPNTRLILIVKDNSNLKSDEAFASLRDFIKSNDCITSIFHIFNTDYQEFLTSFNNKIEINSSPHLPFCIIKNKLYVGHFFNSKNKKNLTTLGIKSIISLMSEKDKEIGEVFGDNYANFVHDENKHDEVEFPEIVELILHEFEDEDTKMLPMLVYSLTGKSALGVAVAALMKIKKWSLEFSVGYLMKLSPCIKVESWLFTQLQRMDDKIKNPRPKEKDTPKIEGGLPSSPTNKEEEINTCIENKK